MTLILPMLYLEAQWAHHSPSVEHTLLADIDSDQLLHTGPVIFRLLYNFAFLLHLRYSSFENVTNFDIYVLS